MAGRPKTRARQAYRMTSRRKAALRKAQLASAAKRKRNAKRVAIGVGAIGAVGLAAYAGNRIGSGKGIAGDLKGRNLSMTNIRNKAAARIAVSDKAKEKVRATTAVSPPPNWRVGGPRPDPLKTVPKPETAKQVAQPKKSAPPKPDLARNNQGGMSTAPEQKNTPSNPSRPSQSPAKVAEIPAQSAEQGRQDMENSPKIMRNGKEWQEPMRDVWGNPADFKPLSSDVIISRLPGGRVNRTNMLKVLNDMAKEQKNLGRALSPEQVEGLRKYYGKMFQLDLSKKPKK
jgi:hypothetical protein